MPLLEKAGVAADLDERLHRARPAPDDAKGFIELCRKLRYWQREPMVNAV